MKFAGFIVAAFLFGASNAGAACFEEVYVPEVLDCSTNGEKQFADFSKGGCSFTPSRIDTVETECPYTWVNIPQQTYQASTATAEPTQASVCSAAGLRPASVDGVVCASGYNRVSDIGDNWASINYRYGKSGSNTSGGTQIKQSMTYVNEYGATPEYGYGGYDGTRVICKSGDCYREVRYCRGGENGSDNSNCNWEFYGYEKRTTTCTRGGSGGLFVNANAYAAVAFLCQK